MLKCSSGHFSSCTWFICISFCLNFKYTCWSFKFFHLYWCNLMITRSKLTEGLLLEINHPSFLIRWSNNFSSIWCFGAGAFFFLHHVPPVFLIFFFKKFDFDDKDAKNFYPCRNWSLMLKFLDSSHFLDLHWNCPWRKHQINQLLVQYLH